MLAVAATSYKAGRATGVSEDEIEASKAFVELGESWSRWPSRAADPSMAALYVVLITKAFGAALGRHWADSPDAVPSRPGLLARWLRTDRAQRWHQLQLSLRVADLSAGDLASVHGRLQSS
jgi:hypothetical protein